MPSSYWTIKLRPVMLFILMNSDLSPYYQVGSLTVWIELMASTHRWRSTHTGIPNNFYLQRNIYAACMRFNAVKTAVEVTEYSYNNNNNQITISILFSFVQYTQIIFVIDFCIRIYTDAHIHTLIAGSKYHSATEG